ncbi:MAG TPA: hypothetical protein PLA12_06145 [Candidatus Hydrogenedens sp.]|nr:hypothetical protein [Candidatus Hydrogenedens sp.]
MKKLMKKTMPIIIALFLIIGFSGCICKPIQEGELTLLSTQFGYKVEGPLGFEGTITKESVDMEEWNFSGKFVFPNQLCFYLGKTVSIAESYPEQIEIRLYTISSLIGQILLPRDKEVPVQCKIKASNDARFRVIFY